MNRRARTVSLALGLMLALAALAADIDTHPFDNCTSLLVGRLASADGSTMTSHSCDSGTDRTWMTMEPRRTHPAGSTTKVYLQPKRTKGPGDPDRLDVGEIPQVEMTHGFLNTAYPIMNDVQLAIGETTIGGRRELVSDAGLLDAPELYRLCLERAETAREAIRVLDELTKAYGYNDWGECFTFADPKEVWFLEIYGPGKGKKGAVWAAVRIPDDEIGVSANAGRIRKLDLKNRDYYMASVDVTAVAVENGWWNPKSGEAFDFTYAYNPGSRSSLGCRRREWRALSLLAPSLNLNPNSENYPFSVKPEKKVTVADILAIFRDAYDGTPYDMTRGVTAVDREGKTVTSPVAGPYLNSDLMGLLKIVRERTISSPAATYVQITQSRSWLPDPVGGVVWLGYDNPATTPHTPFYCGITGMPDSYMIDGRWGYKEDCAWWAFRKVSRLANFRWQDMSKEIAKVWKGIEDKLFADQAKIEEEAAALFKKNPEEARAFLTAYSVKAAEEAVAAYRQLERDLWTKFGSRF
ncbi:MAG: C69 family dipeptidase [Candidatus Aminicenantes bacterium]|nr:C69 family dipeptidase [Candidatus Aminicenantes bacterium]